MPIGNVLIVEDDKEWQEIYLRNVSPHLSGALRVVGTLDDALKAIEEMAFAVAFVDIRLDEDDQQNTDGLRVLEELGKTRDYTSSIMVTGHPAVAITRDALKEHHAYEALGRGEMDPDKIQEIVDVATEERNKRARVEGPEAPEVVRGGRAVWDWDSEMLEVTGSKGGADGLYRMVESLADPYLPLVAGFEDDLLKRHDGTGLAMGMFWSRAISGAVIVAFGQAGPMKAARDGGELEAFAGEPLGEILREREKGGLAGVVAAVPGRSRPSFS